MTDQQFNKPQSFGYSGGNRPYRGTGSKDYIRKNERIRAREVRVIDEAGQQLGVMNTQDAVRLAKSQGLDLVEISPNANPPVCKILSFGKFKYDESKKQKSVAKSPASKVKEIKLRAMIDKNDYATKLRHAIEFLGEGNRVKLTLQFKGRELANTSFGFDVVRRFIRDLSESGSADCEPRLVGKSISVIVTPVSGSKKTIKEQQQDDSEAVKILQAADLLKL